MFQHQWDKNTTWYKKEVVNSMNHFFDTNRHNPETSRHFHFYALLFNEICADLSPSLPKSLFDLGCGTGQLQDYVPPFVTYYGGDLEEIIKGCLYRNYPGANGYYVDIEKDDLGFLAQYDIVVMNGVLDVMQYPLEVLRKILLTGVKYLLVHRQEITTNGETRTVLTPSYVDNTYHSIIFGADLTELCAQEGYKMIASLPLEFNNWEDGGRSFVLKNSKI